MLGEELGIEDGAVFVPEEGQVESQARAALERFAQKKFQVSIEALQYIPLWILLDQLVQDYIAEESAADYIDISIDDLRKKLGSVYPGLNEKLKSDLRLLFFKYTHMPDTIPADSFCIFRNTCSAELRKAFFLIQLVFFDDPGIRELKIDVLPGSDGLKFFFIVPRKYLAPLNAPHYTKSFAGHITNGILNLISPSKKRAMLRADGILPGNIHTSNYGTPRYVVVRAPLIAGRPDIPILHRSGPDENAMVVIESIHKIGLSCGFEEKMFLTKPQSIGFRSEEVRPPLFHRHAYDNKIDRNPVAFLLELTDVIPVSFRKYREATYGSPYKFFDLEDAKKYCDDGAQKFLFASLDEFIVATTKEANAVKGRSPLNEVIGRIHGLSAKFAIIVYSKDKNALLRALAVKELVVQKLKKKLAAAGPLPSWFQYFDPPILIEAHPQYVWCSQNVQNQFKEEMASLAQEKIDGYLNAKEFGFLSFIDPGKLLTLKMPPSFGDDLLVIVFLLEQGYLGLAAELIKKAGFTLKDYITEHKDNPRLKTALIRACQQDNAKLVQIMIDCGVRIHVDCLKAALRKGQLTVLQTLLDKMRASPHDSANLDVAEFLAVEKMKIKIHYAAQPTDSKLKDLLAILDPDFLSKLMLNAEDKDQAAEDIFVSHNQIFGPRPSEVSATKFDELIAAVQKIVLYEMTHQTIFTTETRAACNAFFTLCASSGVDRGKLMVEQCVPHLILANINRRLECAMPKHEGKTYLLFFMKAISSSFLSNFFDQNSQVMSVYKEILSNTKSLFGDDALSRNQIHIDPSQSADKSSFFKKTQAIALAFKLWMKPILTKMKQSELTLECMDCIIGNFESILKEHPLDCLLILDRNLQSVVPSGGGGGSGAAAAAPSPVAVAPAGAGSGGGGGSGAAAAAPGPVAVAPAGAGSGGGGGGSGAAAAPGPVAVSPAVAAIASGGYGAEYEEQLQAAKKELAALNSDSLVLLEKALEAWNLANQKNARLKPEVAVTRTLGHLEESLKLYHAVREVAEKKGTDGLKAFITSEITAVEEMMSEFKESLVKLQKEKPKKPEQPVLGNALAFGKKRPPLGSLDQEKHAKRGGPAPGAGAEK
jgi:hypothetical protein